MNKNPFPELNAFIEVYNQALQKAQSKAIFVRGIEIQEAQVEELKQLIEEIKLQKAIAVEEKDEKKANLILCFELCATAVKNELYFVMSLKRDEPDFAWQALIDAQYQISLAIRNHPFDGRYLQGYAHRLHLYENIIFPKMYFASRGCVVSSSECSVCRGDMEDCEHIKGYAYMGEICYEIINEIKSIDEISLVENPADKSCRMLSFTEDGKSIDIFTHREIVKKADG
ncbi:hypothetical protein [Hymenobacter cellulosivorans]|uniref:Uncharacterized protein n=1 Tax=Hymenobacter cellulosivorans TaxID=2932249 RepID=A0ABY4F377_9BACT|nr:hypothetical protein [Hymenobacter cellulosivorans]UOQ51114.1 hypothetical protein MUN80_15240 [Hymenobacter cellulosivorans]